MLTRCPVAINSGLQRALLRQTHASCSPLSISGASAPGSAESGSNAPHRRFWPHRWWVHPPADQSGWQRLSDAGERYRVHQQTADRVFASCSHAASSAGYSRKERKPGMYGMVVAIRATLYSTSSSEGYFSSTIAARVTSPPCSNPTSAPPIYCGDPYPDDPRGSRMKPVLSVERVMTRDP